MSNLKKTIVFDLDGTLVDSVRDLLPALNRTTALDNVSPLSVADVGQVVGKGALNMIARAFELDGKSLEPKRHKELLDTFLEYYEAHTADKTVFFDGVFEALAILGSDGWQFAVCTNKYEYLAVKLLDALNGRKRFTAVTGGDTFAFKKPDGRHILETIKLSGGDASKSIMVGDSINDIAAAQDISMPSIAVDFGYTDIPVTDMNPTKIISHFNELATAVYEIENLD